MSTLNANVVKSIVKDYEDAIAAFAEANSAAEAEVAEIRADADARLGEIRAAAKVESDKVRTERDEAIAAIAGAEVPESLTELRAKIDAYNDAAEVFGVDPIEVSPMPKGAAGRRRSGGPTVDRIGPVTDALGSLNDGKGAKVGEILATLAESDPDAWAESSVVSGVIGRLREAGRVEPVGELKAGRAGADNVYRLVAETAE